MRQLGLETMGKLLPISQFPMIYEQVLDHGSHAFPLQDEQAVSLIIVFDSIDEFSKSDDHVLLECKTYRDRFLFVIWTINDPENPLGFPITIHTQKQEELQLGKEILQQEQIWIHYLSVEDEQVMHVFSEEIKIPVDERQKALEQLCSLAGEQEVDRVRTEQNIQTIAGETLYDSELLADGIGYYLDYTSLRDKHGEEGAKEKVLTAISESIDMISRHRDAAMRACRFLVWVGEQREWTEAGKEASLLRIYVTPSLPMMEDDYPFHMHLLSFAEFLQTTEEQPIAHGAYPIVLYNDGEMSFIELDEPLQTRLANLVPIEQDNRYI